MLKSNMATTIYEYVSLVILCPLALMIYLLLNYFWPDTAVPALALPVTLFLFLGLTFLFITPRQYLTTVGLTLELTGVTIFGLLKDVAELRTPIFVILLTLGVFLFWLLSEYILLSVRGVKREEMGRLGEMVDGIGLIAQGISLIAKGNGIICCGNGGGDKVCPPPYQFSPRTMGFGDGGGDPGDVGAQVHPPYQFSDDLLKPNLV